MKQLANKIAVVTGGSSGIGLGIAKRFAAEGARVAITGRNQSALDQAAAEIGTGVLTVQGDVSSLQDLDRIFGIVHEKLGKIDILVANAGVYVIGPVDAFTEEMFDQVSDVNFKGVFFTVQRSLTILNDGASVILVSSMVNGKGIPGHAAYAATKAAVRSLARSFSAELVGRGIRVNALTPGPIDTPVFDTVAKTPEEAQALKAGMANFTPVKRVGRPDEIAAAALYLAGDESSFMVGAELLLDGGVREL